MMKNIFESEAFMSAFRGWQKGLHPLVLKECVI